MSPSSSVPDSATTRRTSISNHAQQAHSRHNSSSLKPSPSHSSAIPHPQRKLVSYTALIRLPFTRPASFVDPLPIEWDSAKDKTLWKLISKTGGGGSDLDWGALAERFGVELGFLLTQAAWLYERHFEGVKMQMLRLGSGSGAASPGLGGGEGNGGRARDSRGPTALNTTFARKDSPLPTGGSEGIVGSSPGTPRSAHPGISRTPSTTTVTQSRLLSQQQPQSQQARPFRGSSGSSRRPPAPMRPPESSEDDSESALGHDGARSDDSEQSEDPPSLLRSQAFRRPALAKKVISARGTSELGTLSSDGDAEGEDDEQDSSGGYLPFAAGGGSGGGKDAFPSRNTGDTTTAANPSEILRTTAAPSSQPRKPPTSQPLPKHPETESTSSSFSLSSPTQIPSRRANNNPGPLSPRRQAELVAASEDSPSMGSSFSDLDVNDASVTQSALEDALLSHMQRGAGSGVGSMVSRMGGAFRRG